MRILLFANTTKAFASEANAALRDWLKDRGIAHELFSSGIFEEEDTGFDELSARIQQFDLVCSLGGDGTTLRAAHLVGTTGVPLLSYNFGRLGFLSGAGEGDLIPALCSAIEGTLPIDERTLLEVQVTWDDGQTTRQIALNELVVSRGHFGRILALDLAINGTLIDTIQGDGVLVSTPTGSTAYALSAGGPIIAPGHEGLCVVPISPHSLATRAIVTAAHDVIRLVPNERNRQQLVLFIDGEVFWINPAARHAPEPAPAATDRTSFAATLPATDRTPSPALPTTVPATFAAQGQGRGEVACVEVRPCAQKLRLVRFGDYDFYGHISRTFFGGTHD